MRQQQPLTNAQLLDLVEQALTQPAAERYAWLAANGHPDVLADARRLLDLALSATGQTWSSPTDMPEPAALEGRQIGPFQVERLIGEGGMGKVYLAARNDGQFEQTVAIKVVRVGAAHSAVSQQFDIERQILASLQHPNIAALLDGGTTEDGLHYVVMEFIDGVSLGDYMRDQAPDLRQLLTLYVKICRAVESAHRALIIHRDIKPANILVTPEGEPKLLDFGIAKVLAAGQEATDAKHTILGALTPAYASPEQVRGEPLTTASDVYALGVVLYEALVGERPYDTSDLSPAQTERLLTDATPPLASQRARHHGTALRGDLDAILLKALAAQTSRRYGAAGALADDLERYLKGEPVTAQPDSNWYRLRKLIARNKVPSVAIGLTTVAIVGALFASLYQSGVAREQRSLAVAQLERAEAVSEFLGDILLSPSPNWDSSLQTGANATISDILDVAEDKLADELPDQPAIRIELLSRISEARLWMDQPERAVQSGRAAIAIAEGELPADAPLRVEAHYRLAGALADQNQHTEALAQFDIAMALSRDNGTEGDLLWLYMLNDRAISHQLVGEYEAALAMQSEAIAGLHALYGDEVLPAWAIGYNNLAMLEFMVGDFAAAETSFARSLQGYEAFPEQNLLSGVSALNNLGLMQSVQGRMAEAASMHERALSLLGPLVAKGVGEEDYALTITRLATPYCATGKTDRAVQLLDELTTALGQERLAGHEDRWLVYQARAQCALAAQRFDAAVAWSHQARQSAPALSHYHASAKRAMTAALAYHGSGEADVAREYAAQNLVALETWLGPEHNVVLRAHEALAVVLIDAP